MTARFAPTIYTLGFITFSLMGVLQAAYGPALPDFQAKYQLSASSASLIASLHFLGSAAGTLLSAWLFPRAGLNRSLMTGGVLLAAGGLLVAFAPAWLLVLFGALAGGVGFGLFSSGFNVAFANLGARAPIALNLVNAVYSVGVILAPLVVLALSGGTVIWPFALLGVAFLLLGLSASRAEAPQPQAPVTVRAARRGVPLFALLFLLYVGIEAGIGTWITTHLKATWSTQMAAIFTSLYGVGFAAGRFVGAPIAARFPARTLLPVLLLLATAFLLLARIPAVAPYAYMGAGLCIGPVFPTALAWFGQLYSTRLAPYLLTTGSLGGTLVQPVVGAFVTRAGVDVVPYVLAGNALLTLVVVLLVSRSVPRAVPEQVEAAS